ncbi:aldehyde dehydrogenase family protein [Streptomyces sp. NBC_00669]|uniref:aldehyde dehydrogenase family protein n=1 Tax=unclassified Streptomyces TaxID=2593676 RepID=UPI002E2F496D|nr:aldehyde dehydrogenase family protein [Streptomyces sp. NBC_00669]
MRLHDAALAAGLDWSAGHLVDGRRVQPHGEREITVVSPRDGSVVGLLAAADRTDVDQAVRAARLAFEDGRWSRLPAARRGEILIRFADTVAAHAEELALRIAIEMGKPVREALDVELAAVAGCLRWYGQLADKLADENPASPGDALALVTREPAGVVAAVVPWNFPLTMTAWKLGPALLAGNSVVLKPAEQTSFSALRLGELALAAGLPAGVLNVLPGFGPEAGEALGRHPDVDVLAFTGSVAVGRRFLGYAAESNGKRVWPELGGKSASVILPDADVAKAGRTTAWACFYNQGQMCSASSRMIVHRDVADEAIAAAVEEARRMRPADPLDADAPSGALVSEAHLARVLGHVRGALRDGATLAAGTAERFVPSEALVRGSYLAPVVLTGVTEKMSIAQEEVFGPVLSVLVVDSTDEAVRLANATPYGLAAGLWTRDLSTAHTVARRLKAGSVWVNCYEEGSMAMPFGGTGASGFGRDKSAHAIDKYTDLKSTWFQLEPR